MNLFVMLLVFVSMAGCSFKSEEAPVDAKERNVTPFTVDEKADSDGDLVKDKEEVGLGRNPFLADMPDLRIRFLQNYKIITKYKKLSDGSVGEFVIDTKFHQDNPDFKYRVGEVFIRNESFKNAGSIGKFSGHSWGEIEEHDLSWISYPEIDPRFYSKKQLELRGYFDPSVYEIDSIKIVMENSARLQGSSHFKSVKSLNLNFYYFDYESENYVQLGSPVIERHFNSGVNETFEVVLENVPANLLRENFFKRGEFIVSELGNYEIPELGIKYQTLLASVKAKSLPVIYNTPLESEIYYVGLNGKEASFADIMAVIFPKKVVIEEDHLVKINQFENNLPDFTHLLEIKDQDKKGKWFIFSNKLNQHFLDHRFSSRDVLSLSYLTGNILAGQQSEKIVSYRDHAHSEGGENLYPLGQVSPNTRVNVQLTPKRQWGERKKNWSDSVHSPGGSCGRNCIAREFTCWHEFNLFESVDGKLDFSQDYSGELSRIIVVINQDEFSLKELVDAKKIVAFWLDGNLHLTINDINAIKPILEFEENLLSMKIKEFKETTFNGVKLTNWAGRDWPMCIMITTNVAGTQGWPISVESKDFGQWAGSVRWDLVKRGDPKTYTTNFSIGISAIINNNFN